jgi:hypothetical protein
MKVADINRTDLTQFLRENFKPSGVHIDQDTCFSDMRRYAKYAKFLSDPKRVRDAAIELSAKLVARYRHMMGPHKQDDRNYYVRGAFTLALKELAPDFGFSNQVYILNNQITPETFTWVVSQKILFRDLFTRPHGDGRGGRGTL